MKFWLYILAAAAAVLGIFALGRYFSKVRFPHFGEMLRAWVVESHRKASDNLVRLGWMKRTTEESAAAAA